MSFFINEDLTLSMMISRTTVIAHADAEMVVNNEMNAQSPKL